MFEKFFQVPPKNFWINKIQKFFRCIFFYRNKNLFFSSGEKIFFRPSHKNFITNGICDFINFSDGERKKKESKERKNFSFSQFQNLFWCTVLHFSRKSERQEKIFSKNSATFFDFTRYI